jgi:hypothetical protein
MHSHLPAGHQKLNYHPRVREQEQILEAYPQLGPQAVPAIYVFVATLMHEERFYALKGAA